ncbi:MAG: hypothetical protein NW226_17275 [Microscillaceae bacterium]|nr:hypothetical protein [Microscillaceae bacterium]
MKKTSIEEKKLASAIKDVDNRMKSARSPEEHQELEKEMAELMQKLLQQMRAKK